MRHARFAGWIIALGVVVAVGTLALRRSVAAAEEPTQSAAAAASARVLASLQVSVAANGSLVVFDSSTGDALAERPDGLHRRLVAGKWELVPPAPGASGTAAAPPATAPPAPAAPEVARTTAAKADVIVLMTALKAYRNDTGKFPATEEGLQSLVVQPGTVDNWKGPYLKGEIPKDPWGNPYVYRFPGQFNTAGYDLASLGPDGSEGGGDDVDNWTQQ